MRDLHVCIFPHTDVSGQGEAFAGGTVSAEESAKCL